MRGRESPIRGGNSPPVVFRRAVLYDQTVRGPDQAVSLVLEKPAVSITIEMSGDDIQAIKSLTGIDNDAAAVTRAAREFVRLTRLRELKSASGKVDFDLDWQGLEALELSEAPLPQ